MPLKFKRDESLVFDFWIRQFDIILVNKMFSETFFFHRALIAVDWSQNSLEIGGQPNNNKNKAKRAVAFCSHWSSSCSCPTLPWTISTTCTVSLPAHLPMNPGHRGSREKRHWTGILDRHRRPLHRQQRRHNSPRPPCPRCQPMTCTTTTPKMLKFRPWISKDGQFW